MAPFLSVIVPLYNEESVIREMYRRLTNMLEGNQLDYEIVWINDGSRDGTLRIAKELCETDKRIKLISFSRNFGHQVAITAGMDNASGQVVVIMDADLQDPPEVIVEMLEKWREGYQVVYGVRKKRKGESVFKTERSWNNSIICAREAVLSEAWLVGLALSKGKLNMFGTNG